MDMELPLSEELPAPYSGEFDPGSLRSSFGQHLRHVLAMQRRSASVTMASDSGTMESGSATTGSDSGTMGSGSATLAAAEPRLTQ